MLTLRSYIYPILFTSLYFSFLGFGWKRVAINSGPKNPKDLLKKRRVSRHKLACAYLKGHLTGRSLDWFDVLGYKVVEEKATDYAHLKQTLTEQFPVVRNSSELETRFYASRLEPQLLDYVEVRHSQTTSSLLQLIDNYEERFLNRMTRGPSHDSRNAAHSANNQFSNKNREENWRDTRVDNQYEDSSRPQRLNNQGGRQDGLRNSAFRSQNGQNRISSLRMTPVDLPYDPILLNETFITTLLDTGAEKSFISEEV
ncbi:uncharacterized protein TNCV_35291 [Trichonephila clavipes]|nr:uncharacterized protein TNCV_35291 [Trichonephila clavipes]